MMHVGGAGVGGVAGGVGVAHVGAVGVGGVGGPYVVGGGAVAGANGFAVAPGGVVATGGGGAACCGPAAGGACGADVGCGGEVQTGGSMSYVGGGGSYVLETTYKYVGLGAGTHDVIGTPAPNRLPMFLCIAVIVVLVVVIVVFVMFPRTIATSTTTFLPTIMGPPQSCLLWGDPHVETFDKSFPNFYQEGEFWVVKSPQVAIQARYLATPFTNGLSATHQIVVGGDFMEGHRIAVGPMDNGQITCDDQPILQQFPSGAACGPITIAYNGHGDDVDPAQSNLEKHVVHIQHDKWGVQMEIMRWANHLNARITMSPRSGGQDGACGNFNSNPNDDTTSAINARMGGRIPLGELLFHRQTQAGGQVLRTIADCEMSRRDRAVTLCKQANPRAGGVLLDSCVFDVCFGGDQYAGQDGLSTREAQV